MANTNNTTTKSGRMTQAKRFADCISLIKGEPVENGTTIEEAVAFLSERITALANKNKSGNRKPTAKQMENEGFKADVLAYLHTLPEDCKGKTCSEILRGVSSVFNAGYGVPKISALCYDLVEEGKVVMDVYKNKNIFRAA